VYDLVVGSLPVPDLLLHLRAPVDVLLERIQARGREMEAGVTAEYLGLLERYYDRWLSEFDLCPVLTIRTNDLDFVHKPKHLNIVIERVHEKLTGKDEVEFPQD
ncbi:MAG: deoxynucleoside kinase, partial [Anaerolineales bacterium]